MPTSPSRSGNSRSCGAGGTEAAGLFRGVEPDLELASAARLSGTEQVDVQPRFPIVVGQSRHQENLPVVQRYAK